MRKHRYIKSFMLLVGWYKVVYNEYIRQCLVPLRWQVPTTKVGGVI
jgi:hypothetical protein